MKNNEKCSVCGKDLVDCVCSEPNLKKTANNSAVSNTTGGWGGSTNRSTPPASGGGMFNSIVPKRDI